MAPALRIPVSLDLDSLNDQTQKASDRVGSTLRLVASQFKNLNAEVAGASAGTAAAYAAPWLSSAAKIVTAIGATRLAVGAAALAMGASINEALRQLQEMEDIAAKASSRGVSAEFFQAFTAEAKKARVEVQELEDALKKAFDRLKPTADLEKPFNDIDTGLTGVQKKVTDVETLLNELFLELFDKSKGEPTFLQEFKNAGDSVQGQIRAVLTAMIQLEAEGQKLAALSLGEKVFGPELVDRIRQGKTSAAELRQNLDVPPVNIFSQEQTDRAAEVARQLKVARQELSENLRPAWEGLADLTLTIESAWARIVGLLAKAASITSVFSKASANRQDQQELTDINTRLANNQGAFGLPLTDAGRKQLERRRDTLIGQMLSGLDLYAGGNGTNTEGGDNVPLPRRRPDSAPKAPEQTNSRDRFEASADSIEKRTAALDAEARTIDLGTQAREKARVAAQLEAVAMQINKEAGLGENVVTEEQRKRIEAVAEAYGKAQLAIENARSPLAAFGRESANVGKQLNQFAATSLDNLTNTLADVVTGSKSAAEAFSALAQSIISDLAKIAIRATITGPIASALFGSSALGGLFNVGGGRAGGGPVEPGTLYPVNENTPNSEFFMPSTGGTIVTPDQVRRAAGGGTSVQISNYNDFRGADPGSEARLRAYVDESSRQTLAAAVGAVQVKRSLNPGYLRP